MDSYQHITTLQSTIEQQIGTHESGTPIVRLIDITDDPDDYDGLTDDAYGAEWLADLHAARVELATLPISHRDRASALLYREGSDDPEDEAYQIRRAIAATA